MVWLRSFVRTGMLGVTLAAGLLSVGCQSGGATKPSPDATAGTVSQEAIACDKCKVTWVKSPRTEKNRVFGYTNRRQMVCPECKNAVENLFATGKFEHSCSACGGNMTTCAVH